MEASIENYLDSLRLGKAQVYRNIILFPLHLTANGSPVYVTLEEAIQAKTLTVTEVSQAGSVPELFVVNSGDQPVLLLDGEELLGAKQNRVLNTTILLREKSQTKIPVSCTEHGRWAYPAWPYHDGWALHQMGFHQDVIALLGVIQRIPALGAIGQGYSPNGRRCRSNWANVSSGSAAAYLLHNVFDIWPGLGPFDPKPQLAGFDPGARFENVPFRGNLYRVSARGAEVQRNP